MLRRLPSALCLFVVLLGALTHAAEEPLRAPIATVTLGGGFAFRDSTQLGGVLDQTRTTQIRGISPWTARLKADWFPLRWLGVEGEGLGDFFTAVDSSEVKLPRGSQRGAFRLGVALRLLTPGGFLLNGSLGYGASLAPIIKVTAAVPEPAPGGVFSHGLAARLGLGYSGQRFEGVAGAALLLPLNGRVLSAEPQLWLAGRVIDIGPTALWVGVDASLLLEDSGKADVGYSGASLRVALGVKLALLPPPPPATPLVPVGTPGTSLKVRVLLPDGAPALGALVTLDAAAPVPVDALGELGLTPAAGSHSLKAALSGYRGAEAKIEVPEGKETLLALRLEALTGPGKLSGVVRAASTSKPVVEATVTVGEAAPVQTNAEGAWHVERAGPGPVNVRVEAQGFTTAEEIAQVPPESAATLDVLLEALGKGSPATVRGLVRSRTGEALKASVVIKGLATKVQVTAEGRFFVTVPGGQYQFIISAPGYVTQTKKVVLSDGDQAIVHTELQKVSK